MLNYFNLQRNMNTLKISFLIFFIKILCFTCSLNETTYNISDFRSNPLAITEKEGFFHVALGIPEGSKILAYNDINNDELTDMITAYTNGLGETTIHFYVYNKLHATFEEVFLGDISTYSSDIIIKNLVVNDVNEDLTPDLIVTIYNNKTHLTKTQIFLNTSPNTLGFKLSFEIEGGILIADLNGDRL